jgi:hypothetical protein
VNPRSFVLRNTLRERVATWAHHHHLEELRTNVRRFLGKQPATEAEARKALAFALVTASVGSASLIDRFAAQAGHLPRAERELFAEWAGARFGLLRVREVAPGEWLDGHDAMTDRVVRIFERTGTEQMEPEMWLAVFYCTSHGRCTLEGSLSGVEVGQRIGGVQAGLRAYAALGIEPGAATPAQSRQVANAVYDAINAAGAGAPSDEVDDASFTALDAVWPDTALPELDGLTPREALAAGRRAEVWASATSVDGVPWPSALTLLG